MSFDLRTGDVLDELRKMPSESVHCVVTSPPYWGLRDYGVEGQIGLEDSLPQWVEQMRLVFSEVRRVLRPEGTLWLNLGDAYAGSWGAQSRGEDWSATSTIQGGSMLSARQIQAHPKETGTGSLKNTPGLKTKDLMGQPWRVAFALQADGWFLRCDVVWSKPNPMPESILDRPTKSHEYVFLFAKSERYYYDADAIREPYKPASLARRGYVDRGGHTADRRGEYQPGRTATLPDQRKAKFYSANPAGRNRRSVWEIPTARFDDAHFATFPEKLVEPCILAGTSEAGACAKCGAPRERIIEKGEADLDWQRASGGDANGEYFGVSEKHGETAEDYDRLKRRQTRERKKAAGVQNPSEVKARILAGMRQRRTVGWRPTCECLDPAPGGALPPYSMPCVVLDPFSGSGTTGAVALRFGRRYIGIELNPAYQEIARPRLTEAAAQPGLNFAEAK